MNWLVVLTFPAGQGLLGPIPKATAAVEVEAENSSAAREAGIAAHRARPADARLKQRQVSVVRVVPAGEVTTFAVVDGWRTVEPTPAATPRSES